MAETSTEGLHVGIVTTFPPGSGSLNEYAFHFVRHLIEKPEVDKVTLFVDDLPISESTVDAGHDDGLSSATTAPTKRYSKSILSQAEQTESSAPSEQKRQASHRRGHQADVSFVPCWGFNQNGNVWRILKAVRAEQPDFVIFNIQFASFGDQKIPATLGLMTPAILRLLQLPTIVLTHNIMETVDLKSAGFAQHPLIEKGLRLAGWVITHILLKANLVAVTIPKYVEILEERYGAPNVLLAPHGAFHDAKETPSFELPDGPIQVMTFGKFGTYKRVETLIEAFDQLQRLNEHRLELVIAGTNSPNAPGYLENAAEQYRHVENIRFTGYVAEEDVPRIFSEAAVVVFPYTSTTGSSGVLHQAGEFGKAVILPHIGDLAELITEEGYAGEFFTPNNVESLVTAMARIINDPSHRVELGQQNYVAAQGLPLSDVVDWYLLHAESLLETKGTFIAQGEVLAHS